MRLKLSTVCFVTFVTILLAQEANAGLLCEIFKNCPTTTAEPSASASSLVPIPSSSAPLPVTSERSSSALPTPSSSSILPSSSKPSSIPSATPTSSAVPSSTLIPSLTTALSSSSISSATPTASPSAAAGTSGGSNTGVIVGSVCGFVAIIGAGFLYAFFSKTRRRNNRNKRLYSENEDMFHGDNAYQPDPFANHNSRPSPAIAAAAAVVAADDIHGHNNNQYQQPYNYGNMAPQPPMATIAKQHDPYYATAPAQMGYAADPYYNQQQQYYDPNAGYYDQHYVDSNKQQYDPYSIPQHHSPVLTHNTNNLAPTTNSTVYSAPHSYPDESQTSNTAHSNAGYR